MGEVVIVSIVGGLATIVGGLIVFISNRQLNKSNVLLINADTITKLSKRIDELEERDAAKERRIDELEEQVKKYQRAYTRAIRYIRHIAPNQEMPDFMIDTGELMKDDKRP